MSFELWLLVALGLYWVGFALYLITSRSRHAGRGSPTKIADVRRGTAGLLLRRKRPPALRKTRVGFPG
jgi:hypothetical protein